MARHPPALHRVVAAARRRLVRLDWVNRRLPWTLWCKMAAADSLSVAWVLARRAGRPLTFVQIGSNDGVVHDPLHGVVEACGWTGVLVEPLPELFDRLVANYAGVPGLAFERVAIGATDGTATLYAVSPRPGDPYWVDQLASFDKATILSQRHVLAGLDDRIVEVPIDSCTLPTLVARHELATIDLLHVDVEGYDYEVLRQIDFDSSWAPTFVIYEREHFDRATDRVARRLLRSAGYRLVDIWPDQLAYRDAPRTAPQIATS